MSNIFCKNCGAPIEEDAKFCNNCGRLTTDNSAPNTAQSAPQQAYSNQVPPPQPTRNAYSQPNYSQNYCYPPNQTNYQQNLSAPMTVGQYVCTMLLSAIPIAGLILLFVWAFSSDTNINKKNYARAVLILAAIGIGIYILLLFIMSLIGLGSMQY